MLHEKRFLATLIDAGIGAILAFLFSLLCNMFLDIRFMNFDYYYLFMFTFTMFLYQFSCIAILKTHTIGLGLMSLKLLSRDWEKVNLRQNILRSLSIAVPVLFVVNLLYMFAYKTKAITLFDDISDTMVVNTGSNYHVDETKTIDRVNNVDKNI
jgi:uncharacterized RDD family membrane protein YckC